MRRLWNWLRQDLALKVSSVLLALLLWINVGGLPSSPASLAPVQGTIAQIPIQWRNLPSDLLVQAVEPSAVSITYRAAPAVADGLTPSDFAALVDLSNASPGRLAFNVTVSVPPQVQLVGINPSRVIFTLESLERRTFPIQAVLEGTPQPDYRPGEPSLARTTAEVEGLATDVARVQGVHAPVSLQGKASDLKVTVPLQAVDKDGNPVPGVTVRPGSVEVEVPLELWQTKEVSVIPVFAGLPAEGYGVLGASADPATVQVTGPASRLETLAEIYTRPVSVEGADADVTFQVELDIPTGMEADAGQVTVRIVIGKGP
ncbi:MAG: CdaR family protein [Bacillota bacterium]|nr:CdaR family protein [Bacillota bacterium]